MDPKSTALIVVDMNRAHLDMNLIICLYLPKTPSGSWRG